MSTKLHDIPTYAILGVSLAADAITGETTGESVDLNAGDGTCFLIAPANALDTPSAVAFGAEESSDEVTWAAVTVTPALSVTAAVQRRPRRPIRPDEAVRAGRHRRGRGQRRSRGRVDRAAEEDGVTVPANGPA